MKRGLYIAIFLVALASCGGHKLSVEEAKLAVMKGENENLPLLMQRLSNVESVTIDSIHIRIIDEPMSGYLFTTWKYVVKKTLLPTIDDMKRGRYESRKIEEVRDKQVLVEVDSIRQSENRRGYIEWQTGWADAYRVILKDMY